MLKVPEKQENIQRNHSQSVSSSRSAGPIPQLKENTLLVRSNSICLEKSDIMKFVSEAFRSTKMEKKREKFDNVKLGNRTISDLLSNFKKENFLENPSNISNLVKKREKKSINVSHQNETTNSEHPNNSVQCANKLRQKILIRVLKPKQNGANMIQAHPEPPILLTKEGQQKLNVKNQDLTLLNIENIGSVKVGEAIDFGKNLLMNLNRRKKYSSFDGESCMKIRI